MINITHSIILSKIDFALPIFGHCAYTNLKTLQAPYYAAIRCSIGAFRSCPIKNILAEAGMPSIEDRVLFNSYKLIPKLMICRNKILFQEVNKVLNRSRRAKLKSTLAKCIEYAENIGLSFKPIYLNVPSEPPWLLKNDIFLKSFYSLPKKNITPPVVYKQAFFNLKDKLNQHGWQLIFTDGSKSSDFTTFAVVHNNGNMIYTSLVDNYCSNFTAEASAVYIAAKYATQNSSKFVICTDSLSTVMAIKNTSYDTPLISKIRNICIKNANKIKLLWIPSHVGIPGNELADKAASEAKRRPLHTFSTYETRDILNIIYSTYNAYINRKWSGYQHTYKSINPSGDKPNYPKTCPKNITNIIVRMRTGHTKLTHKHLLEGTSPLLCSSCNVHLSISHILDECPFYHIIRDNIFGSIQPSIWLKNVSDININLIHKFLLKTNLLHKI